MSRCAVAMILETWSHKEVHNVIWFVWARHISVTTIYCQLNFQTDIRDYDYTSQFSTLRMDVNLAWVEEVILEDIHESQCVIYLLHWSCPSKLYTEWLQRQDPDGYSTWLSICLESKLSFTCGMQEEEPIQTCWPQVQSTIKSGCYLQRAPYIIFEVQICFYWQEFSPESDIHSGDIFEVLNSSTSGNSCLVECDNGECFPTFWKIAEEFFLDCLTLKMMALHSVEILRSTKPDMVSHNIRLSANSVPCFGWWPTIYWYNT